MPLTAFDHVNIRTVNLPKMVEWYETVLGLRSGDRPEFHVPGAWLYLGDTCVLHLIEADPAPAIHSEDESLRMEHIAFRAVGLEDFTNHLEEQDVTFKLFPFEALGIVLVFVRDPDGNRLHIDFKATLQD